MSNVILVSRRAAVGLALCAAMVGFAVGPAQARFFVGFGVPFYGPGYYPPAYYPPPPPVYYAPPPVVYAPPANYSQAPSYNPAPAAAGQACYAGPYVCPMDRPVAAGGSCYCLGNGGQRVWGRTN